jgi:hypothetical protein
MKALGHIGMSPADRVAADRKAGRRGGVNNARLTRKLTDDQVRVIRARWAAGEGCRSIAGDYPVSPGAIYSVGLRRTYKGVE